MKVQVYLSFKSIQIFDIFQVSMPEHLYNTDRKRYGSKYVFQ